MLEQAGAARPVRDAVDARLIEQARTRTGSIINSRDEVGGRPKYPVAAAPKDTDGDGIPDDWEQANGLNPRDAKGGLPMDASGYTT